MLQAFCIDSFAIGFAQGENGVQIEQLQVAGHRDSFIAGWLAGWQARLDSHLARLCEAHTKMHWKPVIV